MRTILVRDVDKITYVTRKTVKGLDNGPPCTIILRCTGAAPNRYECVKFKSKKYRVMFRYSNTIILWEVKYVPYNDWLKEE